MTCRAWPLGERARPTALSSASSELLAQWVPVILAPALGDLAVELVGNARLRERHPRRSGRARERERRLRIRAFRPVVRAPGLHDPPVFGELQVLALEVVADLERAADATAHLGGLPRPRGRELRI